MYSIALIVAGLILAVIFTLPILIYGVLNTGNYVGLAISAVLLLYGVFYKKINSAFTALFSKTWGKCVLIPVSLLLAAMFFFAAVVTVNIIAKANAPANGETTAVVLGCRVREDGPSRMLLTRLNAAYDFLTENPSCDCVLTGGKGDDEPIAESKFMYDWLVEKGISPDRLFIEDKSTRTEENINYAKEIIENNGLNPKITVITNEFHQYRAYRFAREAGLESYSYSAETPILLFPVYFVREICGVAHMIFIGSK